METGITINILLYTVVIFSFKIPIFSPVVIGESIICIYISFNRSLT